MKRYFELVGKRQTVLLNIVKGSPAATANVKKLSEFYKTELRELDEEEYDKLTEEYSSHFAFKKRLKEKGE
jgi:hypothetical protein